MKKIITNVVSLRPNKERAQMAMIMLWVSLALQIPTLFIDGLMTQFVYMIMYSDYIPLAAITATMLAQMVLAFLIMIVALISLVTFLQWFHRAYYNLRQLTGQRLLYRTGWAAGAWFVPVLQFYRPYRIVNELHRESKRLLRERRITAKLPKNIAPLWWAFVFLPILPTLISSTAVTLHIALPLMVVNILTVAQWLLQAMYSLLTIKVIHDYSKIETLLAKG